MVTSHLGELVGDDPSQPCRVVEDLGERGDDCAQLVGLALELDAAEPGEPAQRHLEDVVGLGLGEVEDVDEPLAGHGGVVARPDDGDDLVDVDDGYQQALDEVQALVGPAPPELAAPAHDLEAVVEEHPQQGDEAERLGAALDQHDGVDREGVLHGRHAVELLEDGLGVEPRLALDHELEAGLAVGVVVDGGDSGELLGMHELGDALDHLLGAHRVRKLGDDDCLAARRDRVDARRGADSEGAATGRVGVADAVEADDGAAGGKVGPRHEAHEVVERGIGVVEEVAGGRDDLGEVVGSQVGGHAHGDSGGAVDQQVGDGCGEHLGLGLAAVVVGREVDDVLVEGVGHEQGRRGEPRLGVAVGGRSVVEAAEVAVAVDERESQRERLGHAHQGVVDGVVAMGVELAHHLAHHAG